MKNVVRVVVALALAALFAPVAEAGHRHHRRGGNACQPVCCPAPQPVCCPAPAPVCCPAPQPVCCPAPQPVCCPTPAPTCCEPVCCDNGGGRRHRCHRRG